MGIVNSKITYKSGLSYEADIRGHHFMLDAKKEFGGQDLGPTPKEYLLASIAGCSGMDVSSLLKKMRVEFSNIDIETEAETTTGEHPSVFSRVEVVFKIDGANVDSEKAKKCVDMSMTKYCGVSAMMSKAVDIKYKTLVNGQLVGEGKAFP